MLHVFESEYADVRTCVLSRGVCSEWRRLISFPAVWANKKVFIRFRDVNTVLQLQCASCYLQFVTDVEFCFQHSRKPHPIDTVTKEQWSELVCSGFRLLVSVSLTGYAPRLKGLAVALATHSFSCVKHLRFNTLWLEHPNFNPDMELGLVHSAASTLCSLENVHPRSLHKLLAVPMPSLESFSTWNFSRTGKELLDPLSTSISHMCRRSLRRVEFRGALNIKDPRGLRFLFCTLQLHPMLNCLRMAADLLCVETEAQENFAQAFEEIPTTLEKLHLCDSECITDRIATIVLSKCRGLKVLCMAETPVSLCRAPFPPTLTTLKLTNTKVDDTCMRMIAQLCPNLQELNLSNCGNVSDVSLPLLRVGCTKLTSLAAIGTIITCSGIRELSSLRLEKLVFEAINIHALSTVSLPYLTSLKVQIPGCVTAEELQDITISAPKLHTLSVSQGGPGAGMKLAHILLSSGAHIRVLALYHVPDDDATARVGLHTFLELNSNVPIDLRHSACNADWTAILNALVP